MTAAAATAAATAMAAGETGRVDGGACSPGTGTMLVQLAYLTHVSRSNDIPKKEFLFTLLKAFDASIAVL